MVRPRGGAVRSPFPDNDNALPLAGLVLGEAAVEAVLLAVLRPDVAAEIGAVHLDGPAGAADLDALGLRRHRLTDLVGQHERGLVLDVQVARQGERALALHFVEEDDDGGEVDAQRELVKGKQRAAGRAEVPVARLAPPAWRAIRPAAIITAVTTAVATLAAQRIAANTVSASLSVMPSTAANDSVRAAAESRKCWPLVRRGMAISDRWIART